MKALLKHQYSIAGFMWSILFGAYILYPGKVDPFSMLGFYLSLFFCLLLLIGSFFPIDKFFTPSKNFNTPNQEKLDQLNKFFLAISLIGISLHLWDKVGIRGYNYFSCTDIRELWLADGAQRKTNISSWQSALGHILVYFTLFPVIFSDLRYRFGKIIFSSSCVIFIVYCWTIVSRSSLLAFSIICIASFHQFYSIGYITKKDFIKKFATLFSLLFLFVVLTFSKKIGCTDLESTSDFVNGSMREHKLSFDVTKQAESEYQYKLVDKMFSPAFETIKYKLELPSEWFKGNNKAAYVSNAIPLYMGNGINNFTQVATKITVHDYKFLFNPFIGLANKILGQATFEPSELRRTFTQGFINFPGAVHLTFGKWGIFLLPLVMGFILRFFYLFSSKNILFIPFASFLMSFAILAPLTNLTSNMSTPFLFFSSIISIVIAFFFQRKPNDSTKD